MESYNFMGVKISIYERLNLSVIYTCGRQADIILPPGGVSGTHEPKRSLAMTRKPPAAADRPLEGEAPAPDQMNRHDPHPNDAVHTDIQPGWERRPQSYPAAKESGRKPD